MKKFLNLIVLQMNQKLALHHCKAQRRLAHPLGAVFHKALTF